MSTESQNYRETIRVGIAVAVTVFIVAIIGVPPFVATGIFLLWVLGLGWAVLSSIKDRNNPSPNLIRIPTSHDQFNQVTFIFLGFALILLVGVLGWLWKTFGLNQGLLLVLGVLLILRGFTKGPGGSIRVEKDAITLGNKTTMIPGTIQRTEVTEGAIRFLTEDRLLEKYTGLNLNKADIKRVSAFLQKHLHDKDIHISQG
ncbi:MAG: hypothetical protein AB8F95_08260 [Bacteroidia bacterium]